MISDREMILRPIHDEAEQAFAERGWQDGLHDVWVQTFTAERLVSELARERRHCHVLEDRILALESLLEG